VVTAIKNAADKFLHISSDYWHEGQIALSEKMNALSPMREPVLSFFCQSGTESVEGALKLARYVTGRGRFIGFLGGFHGRTMGSLSFTSSKYTQQKGFFPTMPGVTHVPYPNNYRPIFAGEDQGAAVLSYIENVLFKSNVPASEVAVLLIFDEVQSGIGRSGRMFAAEHFGVAPDIMTLAKGLGSGLPIGMVVAKKTIMEKWQRGAHGNTYGGNPICCAAALATVGLVEREYAANAARTGEYFIARLRELKLRYDCVGDVRGKGLMLGMELVESRSTKTPAAGLCDRLVTRAYHNGLLLLMCGQSTIRFMPPLMITPADVDEALTMLTASLDEVLADDKKTSGAAGPADAVRR
jgi:4-aminobutyrate aminotransferase